MAWDDAPPTKEELAANNTSWDSTPPSKAELQTAGVDAPKDKPWYSGAVDKAKRIGNSLVDTLPASGAAIGGLVGGVAGEGIGAFPGAALGGAAGAAAKNVIRGVQDQGLDYLTGKPTVQGTINSAEDQAAGGVQGLSQEMGGKVIGSAISKGAGLFKTSTKPALDQITQAALRLGIKPTTGMTNASPVVQGLESSINQSPSIAGAMVRAQTGAVMDGLKSAANEVLEGASGPSSKIMAGREGMKNLTGNLAERYNNVQMAYEPFNQELPKMFPDLESKFQLADKVAKAGQNNLSLNSDINGYATKVSNAVMNSSSLADLESVRKQIGGALNAAYRSGDSNAIDAISKMQDHLADFRDDQFVSLASQARPGMVGGKMGEDMVQEYQNAQQTYKSLVQDMKPFMDTLGIRNKNPKAAIEAMQDIPDEKVASSLFNTNKVSTLEKLQQYFPEQYDNFRKAKLVQIQSQSLAPNGEIDPAKLVRNADKLDPVVQKLVFGPNASKLDDMRTLVRAFPSKMGPSGTPQGELFNQSWNPGLQAAEMGRYGIYRGLGSPGAQGMIRNAQGILQSPQAGIATQIPGRILMNSSQGDQ